MNNDVFKAILAMDSYNRSYGAKVDISGTTIGTATIASDSEILIDSNGDRRDAPVGFYAIAYTIGTGENAETVISYRGTDGPMDVFTGWTTGLGAWGSPQAQLAAEFYHAVAEEENPFVFSGCAVSPRSCTLRQYALRIICERGI